VNVAERISRLWALEAGLVLNWNLGLKQVPYREAILPNFERQQATIYLMESQPTKKIRNISEGEYCVQIVVNGFFLERFYKENPYTLALGHGGHGQRPYFSGGRCVKMERTTSEEQRIVKYNREIANVFGDFKLGAGEHDAFRRVGVDQLQKGGNVPHGGLTDCKVFTDKIGLGAREYR
jgi:hypothetical protein